MKKSIIALLACAAVVLSGCSTHPHGIKHVILIGLDGMSAEGMQMADTPFMDSLMANGAYSFNARMTHPTSSCPNWTTKLNGVSAEVSGYLFKDFDFSARHFAGLIPETQVFPTVYTVIKDQIKGAHTGGGAPWADLSHLYGPQSTDGYYCAKSDEDNLDYLEDYIVNTKPDFCFMQLDLVDSIGHRRQHMSQAYLNSINVFDGYVRRIVNAVKKAGIESNTLVMVVADHGGWNFRHSYDYTYNEFYTPVIYYGAGVKKGYKIQQQIYGWDVAADVIFALGLKAPQMWMGRPVKAAFKGFSEPEGLYEGPKLLPTPIFESYDLKHAGKDFYNGYCHANILYLQKDGSEVRYTTDGTVPTRTSALYEGPIKVTSTTHIKAKVFSPEGESNLAEADYIAHEAAPDNGLNYTAFNIPGCKTMPSFEGQTPIGTGVSRLISFPREWCYKEDLVSGGLKDLALQSVGGFGARFEGWLQIDVADLYKFSFWGQQAVRLWIDGKQLLDSSAPKADKQVDFVPLREMVGEKYNGSSYLTKGLHQIRVEWYCTSVEPALDMYYSTSTMPITYVPCDKLWTKRP